MDFMYTNCTLCQLPWFQKSVKLVATRLGSAFAGGLPLQPQQVVVPLQMVFLRGQQRLGKCRPLRLFASRTNGR